MTYEVDYYNTEYQTRTKIVEVEEERLIPFVLAKLDKRFEKVRSVKPVVVTDAK